MYKQNQRTKSQIQRVEIIEGEPIEHKIERLVNNNEPIKDGSPEIFTPRKDGVVAAYNIRADRWEIAAEAMDKVQASIQAKRDAKYNQQKEDIKEASELAKETIGEAKSTQGEAPKNKVSD